MPPKLSDKAPVSTDKAHAQLLFAMLETLGLRGTTAGVDWKKVVARFEEPITHKAASFCWKRLKEEWEASKFIGEGSGMLDAVIDDQTEGDTPVKKGRGRPPGPAKASDAKSPPKTPAAKARVTKKSAKKTDDEDEDEDEDGQINEEDGKASSKGLEKAGNGHAKKAAQSAGGSSDNGTESDKEDDEAEEQNVEKSSTPTIKTTKKPTKAKENPITEETSDEEEEAKVETPSGSATAKAKKSVVKNTAKKPAAKKAKEKSTTAEDSIVSGTEPVEPEKTTKKALKSAPTTIKKTTKAAKTAVAENESSEEESASPTATLPDRAKTPKRPRMAAGSDDELVTTEGVARKKVNTAASKQIVKVVEKMTEVAGKHTNGAVMQNGGVEEDAEDESEGDDA